MNALLNNTAKTLKTLQETLVKLVRKTLECPLSLGTAFMLFGFSVVFFLSFQTNIDMKLFAMVAGVIVILCVMTLMSVIEFKVYREEILRDELQKERDEPVVFEFSFK